jgi:hypothetical protein
MVKKLLVSCLVVILILPAVVSCSAQNVPETAIVPGTANMVVQIQVGRILSNPALSIAYDELAKTKPTWPQTADDALNQLVLKTGLDLSSVSSAVLFADVESTNQTQNTYAGLIASSNFSESALIAQVQQRTKQTLTASNYKGLTIYAGDQDKFEIAFLSQGQLVLGMPKAVRDTIDVKKGDQKPLSGNITDTLNRFGAALITGAFAPPTSFRNQLGNVTPQESLVSAKSFKDIDAIGFAVDQPSLSLSVRIDAHFSNTASVQDAKDSITGLISVAKGSSQDPNIKTALGNIQVSTTDLWLSVNDLSSLADFATVIGSVQTKK